VSDDVLVKNCDGTVLAFQQTEDQSKGRRFPGTVRAEKTIDTVLVNDQVNVVEHLLILRERMDEVPGFNYGHRNANAACA
jgi:hypothetical protein